MTVNPTTGVSTPLINVLSSANPPITAIDPLNNWYYLAQDDGIYTYNLSLGSFETIPFDIAFLEANPFDTTSYIITETGQVISA